MDDIETQMMSVRWRVNSLYAHRVRTGHGNPGKSWNLIISFSRPGKSWNLGWVMESHGISVRFL